MFDLRQELISNGVLTLQGGLYQFTQDYIFSAPSTAAAVVLGRSANGRVEWKAAVGHTLKEIQEAEAGQWPFGGLRAQIATSSLIADCAIPTGASVFFSALYCQWFLFYLSRQC